MFSTYMVIGLMDIIQNISSPNKSIKDNKQKNGQRISVEEICIVNTHMKKKFISQLIWELHIETKKMN